MKQISFWAQAHKRTSRLLIIFIGYPILNIAGIIMGIALNEQGVSVNAGWLPLLALMTTILFCLYPEKGKMSWRNSYVFRKSLDSLLLLVTFCMVTFFVNRLEAGGQGNINSSYAANAPEPLSIKPVKHAKMKISFIRKLIKNYHKKTGQGGKIALIVLVLLVAFFAVFGVAALCCSLSCSGSEAAGLVVFILGLGLVVFLVVRLIRRIVHGPKNKEQPMPSAL